MAGEGKKPGMTQDEASAGVSGPVRGNHGVWLFSIIAVIVLGFSVSGVLLYIQFNEIRTLKSRVLTLELSSWARQDVGDQEGTVSLLTSPDFLESLAAHLPKRSRRQTAPDYTALLQQFAASELQVLRTYCTNSTKICVRGQPGQKGNRGTDGFPGTKGEKGHYGISGPTGPRGYDGTPGPRGPKGEPGTMLQGMTGPKGDKGDRGEIGPQGAMGTASVTSPVNPNKCCDNLSAPQFLRPQTAVVTAPYGSSVILPCSAVGLPHADISWVPPVDPLSLGRYIQEYNGMELQNVKYTDSMTFKCRAHNIFGTVEKYIKLIVTDKVTASVSPSQSSVVGGPNTNVDIVCSWTGTPPPNITWTHVLPGGKSIPLTAGTALSTITNTSTLHVTGAGALDAGMYQCTVTNGIETQTSTANVIVQSKPGILTGPLSQTVLAGQTIVLRCDVIATPPASVVWTYPHTGTAPPKDVLVNPDGSITIQNINDFNQGTYTCSATNGLGTTTATGQVNVISPVTVSVTPSKLPVHAGDTFTQIACSGTGDPNPTLTWTADNGQPVTSSGGKFLLLGNGELIITNVDPDSDSGIYTCTGNNGKETATAQTIVYNDLGTLSCTTTFADCSTTTGRACGGRCPGNCDTQGGAVYGYKLYTPQSVVCLSAKHAGTAGNDVIWHIINGGSTYESKLSNGIQSQFSGPLAETAQIWEESSAPAHQAGVPILG
ncbi:hemicentin-2-like [Mizuhopecten yessoensis]|uniref:Peroxidasin-like n=1 Tax=Mizuhopecten yessoensis TaxID=6573 RepID=A0A210QMK8_MIZYE|nr:hemicentin-2-like [Mizuhopecten yessoensis]OWF49966.1 Peroxidasin-like [Mizuhopecten yessoensis]